ncbi:MAG TPA: FAD/NAD(P)-binding protein [Methylocella sp.]|nr:FAD/NAD(P)-binding protein [Methylocella sp.]
MSGASDDHRLGMHRPITRRDFLDGVAVAAGAAALGHSIGQAAAEVREPRPPERRLSGQTNAAFEVMHAIRDGTFWDRAGSPFATGERYDLIVVGAGISGLASAFLYRQRTGSSARILILDNCSDFGGHATRNEFTASNGRLYIGYGGSQTLQSPSFFSPAVMKLIADVGIDLGRFKSWYDQGWPERHGLAEGVFFRKEDFGQDVTVRMEGKAADWVPRTPLNAKAKRDLAALIDTPGDYLSGKSRAEKRQMLAAATYADFLTKTAGADPQLLDFFKKTGAEYFGTGIDAIPAIDAYAAGLPGFGGMDLGEDADPAMSPSGRLLFKSRDAYIHHFPDGNASLARAIVRALIPGAQAGSTMEDLVLNPVNYGRLDDASNAVRVRLRSTCVKLRHTGPLETAESVEAVYFRDGRLETVTAAHMIIACWHRVVPLICDEIGKAQQEALRDQVKVPLVYGNVLIRNWEAFRRIGLSGFTDPGGFWDGAFIDFPVSVGSYRFPSKPSEPILLHLPKTVIAANGASPREQSQAGRASLLTIAFEDYEREIRDLLGRALSGGGFDPAEDIEAITVNRWSHGYSCEYMRPWDSFWPDGPLPIYAARKGWGRIAIANADSGAYAYAHSAIDQAARAVAELLGPVPGEPEYTAFPGPPRDRIGL